MATATEWLTYAADALAACRYHGLTGEASRNLTAQAVSGRWLEQDFTTLPPPLAELWDAGLVDGQLVPLWPAVARAAAAMREIDAMLGEAVAQ